LNPEATRRKIVAVAARLFAAQGYHETTLAEIAGETSITAPSLIYHYPTKEALCDAVLRDTWRRIGDELRPILTSGVGVEEMFAGAVGALVAIEARDGALFSAISAAMLSGQSAGAPALHDTLLPLLDEIDQALRAAEPGRIHPDAPLRDLLVYIQLARSAQYRMGQIVGNEAELDPSHELYFIEALFKAVLDWRPAADNRSSRPMRAPTA
jgi:AcrR family transcriptional regulator